ncbi:site-specific integrase [Paraliobacillus quinghaiensis]|uniref:Site-specific integrase n=1 Tax=Paraliobacillus quinghaiensis TaxID=470815 RepID=A0A917TSA5_9BACI|nr:site-specific integrase [Paraliobacillus quinghaiensis]GGM34680.1 site-specific integrase [Paraliobacillus quinghaiensis]
MSQIKKYTKKNGSTAYFVRAYLGYDPKTGKQRQTTKRGFKTKKEAKSYLISLQAEVDKFGAPEIKKRTFKEVYEEWFEQHSKKIKPSSAKALQSKFNRILPQFGHLDIKSITPQYCQKVINEWADELKSFKDYKIQSNLVLKYAQKMDYIITNPFEKVTLPVQKDHFFVEVNGRKENFYSKKELKDFLSLIKDEPLNYTFFHLAAYSGARKGEILALNWSDISFDKKLMYISKTLYFEKNTMHLLTPKYTSSNRVISLDPDTILVLQFWKQEQFKRYQQINQPILEDQEQPIFTNYHQFHRKMGRIRLAYFNDQLIRIIKNNAQLRRISIHGFRHTHASLLISSGASPKDVQERLGHKDIQTTFNVYVHLLKEAKAETANKFYSFMNDDDH